MPVKMDCSLGKKTQLKYNKLLVAKANEVISGGEVYYSDLAKKLNKGRVATYVRKNADSFELNMGQFITKKQSRLEKMLDINLSPANPPQRFQDVQEIAKRMPEHRGLQNLTNIYKYFAEKTRPEIFY